MTHTHASRSDEGKAVQTHARAAPARRRLPLLCMAIFPERLLIPEGVCVYVCHISTLNSCMLFSISPEFFLCILATSCVERYRLD